jgi:hypothetical protein
MSNKKPVISFRIRPDIKAGVQKLADADRRSLSSYIEMVLEAHLKQRSSKKPEGKKR